MDPFENPSLTLKALQELGPMQMGLYGLYRLGLRSGYIQRTLDRALKRQQKLDTQQQFPLHQCLTSLPERQEMNALIGQQAALLKQEADGIVHGSVSLFGGKPYLLTLALPGPLAPWTSYDDEDSPSHRQDIKFTWEQGRFGWACKLAMAYHLSGNENYAEAFWHYTELFLSSNPPYLGPHWSSAQEAAIRLIALAFSIQIFAQSEHSTPERMDTISSAIAIHAERIPPTLVYARAQNNNHLITEALGMYTAAALLVEHPQAARWHTLGWQWLMHAFRTQIDPDGTYVQHSTNYHRLMLQCAIWTSAVKAYSFKDEPYPADVANRLEAATYWLWKLVDPDSGKVPNLGHNDGAYILPLSVRPYEDYRPVVHAAARVFLKQRLIPAGAWDDMSAWMCAPSSDSTEETNLDAWHQAGNQESGDPKTPYIMVNQANGSWATLRAAQFHSRPAHADQLHLDLWWRGMNIAQDPGTYLYNALPPWQNSLTSALVHNSVTVDGEDIMQRINRFLYLDWAQASIHANRKSKEGGWESLSAQHNGYQKMGITHSRMVQTFADGHWEVLDLLDGPTGAVHTARLHWLLPDWDCEIYDLTEETGKPSYALKLNSPYGWIELRFHSPSTRWKELPQGLNLQLARGGEVLHGANKVSPILGWTSPTYGDKIPALACIVEVTQGLPIDLMSEWIFPSES